MRWFGKGRQDMEPAVPAPISDLLAQFGTDASYLVTGMAWHCGQMTGRNAAGEKVSEANVVLTLSGKPVGTLDETTSNFFFDHQGAVALLEVATAMNIHQAKHERGVA